MNVASGQFAAFFVVLLAAHTLCPPRAQRGLLLAASVGFVVAGGLPGLGVLVVVVAAAWLGALGITHRPSARWAYPAAGALVLAPLVLFRLPGVSEAGFAAPLGVSFFALQAFAYVQDVHRGDLPARRSPWDVALLVAFFPKLASGPIERPAAFLEQLDQPRPRWPLRAEAAVLLILWGLFKKLVVADHLAPVVDRVYALNDMSFPLLLAGSTAFLLQVYADFSGWTDLARGTALLLGFELSANFRAPYLSTSLTEFWRRWHITLLAFLRDRVYLPLAGSRPSGERATAALIATFVLSGLWHGATLNFFVWGLYNGVILAIERRLGQNPRLAALGTRTPRLLRVLGTLFLVDVGFILFRERGGLATLAHDAAAWAQPAGPHDWAAARYMLALCALLGAPLLAWDLVEDRRNARGELPAWTQAFAPRLLAVVALLLATLSFAAEVPVSFVYAQF